MREKKNVIIVFAIIVIATIVCGCILFFENRAVSEANAKSKENAETIEELKKQLSDVTTENEETVEEIQVKLNSASTAGNRMAELQNERREVEVGSNGWEEKSSAITDEIKQYTDESNGIGPWYGRTNAVKCHWQFESTYSFSGNEIPAVWTCRNDGNGELLAYAMATYHADTGKFTDLDYHQTSVGATYLYQSTDE